jgi:hypothetical protein
MIDFMIIAAPRSGTAWAANWLTDSHSFCHHDPLFERHYSDLDAIESDGRVMGVACTGLANFTEFVNGHPAKKIVLHRRPDQVNDACLANGFEPVPMELFKKLESIQDALHVPWTYLFQKPEGIHRFLFGDRPFDARRHRLLVGLNVQRDLEQIKPNKAATRRLIEEMRNA